MLEADEPAQALELHELVRGRVQGGLANLNGESAPLTTGAAGTMGGEV